MTDEDLSLTRAEFLATAPSVMLCGDVPRVFIGLHGKSFYGTTVYRVDDSTMHVIGRVVDIDIGGINDYGVVRKRTIVLTKRNDEDIAALEAAGFVVTLHEEGIRYDP